MKLSDLTESDTAVPIEASIEAVVGSEELAVVPVRDLERGTACLLIAKTGRLWIVLRTSADDPQQPPTVTVESVEWRQVGIGPLGRVGRVPGGVLGGPESTHHLLTVAAGDRLYEAKMPGVRGMEAVEGFASVALHAGARDYEL